MNWKCHHMQPVQAGVYWPLISKSGTRSQGERILGFSLRRHDCGPSMWPSSRNAQGFPRIWFLIKAKKFERGFDLRVQELFQVQGLRGIGEQCLNSWGRLQGDHEAYGRTSEGEVHPESLIKHSGCSEESSYKELHRSTSSSEVPNTSPSNTARSTTSSPMQQSTLGFVQDWHHKLLWLWSDKTLLQGLHKKCYSQPRLAEGECSKSVRCGTGCGNPYGDCYSM